jgi:hypothetical protein
MTPEKADKHESAEKNLSGFAFPAASPAFAARRD